MIFFISKKGHILGFWVDVEFGRTPSTPRVLFQISSLFQNKIKSAELSLCDTARTPGAYGRMVWFYTCQGASPSGRGSQIRKEGARARPPGTEDGVCGGTGWARVASLCAVVTGAPVLTWCLLLDFGLLEVKGQILPRLCVLTSAQCPEQKVPMKCLPA